MTLNVLNSHPAWYSAGLRFGCTQCGNCCTGGPGYVWISTEETERLAEVLKLSVEETVERYCRMIGSRLSLKEERNGEGIYDCIFLKDSPGGKRTCGVYSARPRQCREWPFWAGNLASREAWDRAGVRCPGINRGELHSAEQIEGVRER